MFHLYNEIGLEICQTSIQDLEKIFIKYAGFISSIESIDSRLLKEILETMLKWKLKSASKTLDKLFILEKQLFNPEGVPISFKESMIQILKIKKNWWNNGGIIKFALLSKSGKWITYYLKIDYI